jgi:hypothetical protein
MLHISKKEKEKGLQLLKKISIFSFNLIQKITVMYKICINTNNKVYPVQGPMLKASVAPFT